MGAIVVEEDSGFSMNALAAQTIQREFCSAIAQRGRGEGKAERCRPVGTFPRLVAMKDAERRDVRDWKQR